MTRKTIAGCVLLVAFLGMTLNPGHAVTFNVNYQDSPSEGFNDPTPVAPVGGNPGTTLGEQRLNVFQAAADIWGAALESDVTIQVYAKFDALSCDASSSEATELIFGALLEDEGLVVAVFTDGRDPARARRWRDRIAAFLAEDLVEEEEGEGAG